MNQIGGSEETFTHVSEAVKIAILLRALRNAFGLSQAELAALAKCSRPTINRIESIDKASPRSSTVDDLLAVFRDKGVEIQTGNDAVAIRFNKSALLSAALGINGGQVNVLPEVNRESKKEEVNSQPVDLINKPHPPGWGSW